MQEEIKDYEKDTVAFLMPCESTVDTMVTQNIALLTAFSSQNGYKIKMVGMTKRVLIHSARNTLADEFVKSKCEWSFWMDSDMILEPRTIPVMINWAKKLNAKALTAIYYQRTGGHRPLILKRTEEKNYTDEYSADNIIVPDNMVHPFKIDTCGFGCVVLHKTVFKDLKNPYFKNIYLDDKQEVSEDFYFCKTLRDNKIDLWCIPELQCGHLGNINIVDKSYCKIKGEVRQIKLN